MDHYELMVIYSPNLDEEALSATKEKLQNAITDNGGVLGEINDMGKRRLAYEINDLREGIYQVVNFEADNADLVNELDRIMKIDDRFMRHLIVNMTRDRNESNK